MKKTAALATSLLLVGFGATACGGSDKGADAPKDASKEDFCAALKSFDGTDEIEVADHLDEMKEVGTPADMPDDARKGFEFLVDHAAEIDEKSDELKDRPAFDREFGVDVSAQFFAFYTYFIKECGSLPTE